MSSVSLEGKVVLITGSTTGIGAALARKSSAVGARVLVHGLEEEWGRAIVAELDGPAHFVRADLVRPEAANELVDAAVEHFGRLDILVNNAASCARSKLETTDAEVFDRMIGINLRAPLLLCRAAVAVMRRQGDGGAIVNVGSINGRGGGTDLLPYSISKGGLTTMTRNLSKSLAAEGIRVNQVSPGWVLTENEILRKIEDGLEPGWEERIDRSYAPLGRLVTPEEIAEHILFWMSDASAPASGVEYIVEQRSAVG